MENFREKVKEALASVLPITMIVLILSVVMVPVELGAVNLFLAGADFFSLERKCP